MKKFTLALIVLVLLSGCITSPLFKMSKGVLDFRSYTEKGFFISPSMEGGNLRYNPIGIVSMSFSPGVIVKEGEKPQKQLYQEQRIDPMGYSTETQQKFPKTEDNFFDPSEEYMLEQLVEYAKSLGANGLLNYKIHYNYPITPTTMVTAFAVLIEK